MWWKWCGWQADAAGMTDEPDEYYKFFIFEMMAQTLDPEEIVNMCATIDVRASIYRWQKAIHANAIRKGWWRDGDKANIPEKLALIHSEISEALEEYRAKDSDILAYRTENGKPEGFPIELADIVIRVMDLAGFLGLDLADAMARKHSFNIYRSYRHGGKRC